jgi:precorrin-2/cobalt-factor-2 C20-methyltransferase
MQGSFYVVGVGPGDPELLTLKAVGTLKKCPVWFVPSAFENGGSMALKIVSGVVSSDRKTIISHRFPMKAIYRGQAPDPEVKMAWDEAGRMILQYIHDGYDVAFPTLGDPAIYSTGFYVCETLMQQHPSLALHIIPGVSAIGASSAAITQPLCLGDERLVVIPATFENEKIKELLANCDVAVFMKVYKVMDKLIDLLKELGLADKAVLVERCSMPDQKIWHDIHAAASQELHYFSTMIVRKG